MRLKLFRAAGMPQAMAEIRAELGPDALILSSRRIHGGIEVTAGCEDADDPVSGAAAAEPDRMAVLAYHNLPAPLAERLRDGPLESALAGTLRFAALALEAGRPPILAVGPPGAGKSVTVARLATRLVAAGARPLVVSADRTRAGGVEQLGALTALLGLDLRVASHPAALARALARREAGAPVLIDTPGIDALDPAQVAATAALAEAAGGAMLVVVPGGLDCFEAGEIAHALAEAGASMMVANRLDATRRLGGVITASACGLDLVEAGIGPGAADGLVPITPALLAARMRRHLGDRP